MIAKVYSIKFFLIILYLGSSTVTIDAQNCKCDHDNTTITLRCNNKIEIDSNDTMNCYNAAQELFSYISTYISKEPSEVVSSDTFQGLYHMNLQAYISHLWCNHNAWTTLKSSAFVHFWSCSFFNLSSNNIKVVEVDAFKGLSLKSLDLSNNSIQFLLPKTFESSQSLHRELSYLNLSYNALIYVPNDVFYPLRNLKYLYLGHNFIHYLELNSFRNLRALNVLDLNYNRLSALNNTLHPLVSLKILDLSSNNISLIVSSDLDNLNGLETLNISNNTLSKIDMDCFEFNGTVGPVRTPCKDFKSFSNLTSVYLTNNRLPFPETISLYRWTNLKFLNVSNNYLKNYDLFSSFSLLTTLDISNCNINSPYSNFYHAGLTTLIVDYKILDEMSVNYFLYKFRSVKHLGLRGTAICCDKINEFDTRGINVTLIDVPRYKCFEICVANIPEQNLTTTSEKPELPNKTKNNYLLWILLMIFLVLFAFIFVFVLRKCKRQIGSSYVVHHVNLTSN